MGRLYKVYLSGRRIYTCANCQTHLAQNTQVISKAFQRSSKKAYLFKHCENILLGDLEDRILLNGVHTVANIICLECKTTLGWKYIEAYEDTEKYKVGRFLIERAKIRKETGWVQNFDENMLII